MSRYIDANAYIKYCEEHWIPLNIDAIKKQPTADMVDIITNELTNKISERIIKALEENYDIIPKKPMIQCKDCKHWNTAECHSTVVPDVRKCMVMNVFTDPDQFCKYGERITDNVKNEEVNIYKMIASLEEIKNVLREEKKR